MKNFATFTITDDNSEPIIRQCAKELLSGSSKYMLVLLNYVVRQHWLEAAPSIMLTAIYLLVKNNAEFSIKFAVSDDGVTLAAALQENVLPLSEESFELFCSKLSLPCFSNEKILRLDPVSIPKPWGREIWYTGIEARGVASFSALGNNSPIPWVLSALPEQLSGGAWRSLILLKILAPLADEVRGDLYFELHEKKREVYVVTAVDSEAWSDGVGAIRFGFDQSKRSSYDSDEDFKTAFLLAVESYEVVRRKIDAGIDKMRLRDGFDMESLPGDRELTNWQAEIPTSWHQEERDLRRNIEQFTAQLPLVVGDVVKVPCYTPHALQHGVRTVEFQTPVYERLILSFGQKVQTQTHWDTKKAVGLMSLEDEVQESFEKLPAGPGVSMEKIVEFEDFCVLRVVLEIETVFNLPAIERYMLLMTVSGLVKLDSEPLAPEQSALLPNTLKKPQIEAFGVDSACFLLAYPK